MARVPERAEPSREPAELERLVMRLAALRLSRAEPVTVRVSAAWRHLWAALAALRLRVRLLWSLAELVVQRAARAARPLSRLAQELTEMRPAELQASSAVLATEPERVARQTSPAGPLARVLPAMVARLRSAADRHLAPMARAALLPFRVVQASEPVQAELSRFRVDRLEPLEQAVR